MTSAIRHLLDEISWEGNARKYRSGGLGKENVLTTEVFQALDFLPRQHFLGSLLDSVEGQSSRRPRLAATVEQMSVSILPGDLAAEEFGVEVQPDALLTSDSDFILVEAKAIRRSSFQVEQLAREVLVAQARCEGRSGVVLLVLGGPPPILVKGLGRVAIDDAVRDGLRRVAARTSVVPEIDVEVLWTTWGSIAEQVRRCVDSFSNPDPSVTASVHRLGDSILTAIDAHG
jgi:hypothetical protein